MRHEITDVPLAIKVIKVAQKLIKENWVQDWWKWDITGALNDAVQQEIPEGVGRFAMYDAINDELAHRLGTFPGGVEAWNDHPTRTKEEVLFLLDGLIEDLRSENSTLK